MSLRLAGPVAFVAIISMAGCTKADRPPGGDAGMRQLALDSAVVLRIPSVAEDGSWVIDDFDRIRLLRNGGIAVANQTELHIFGADGRHLATLGRRGDGPGEFGHINGFAECSPGVYVVSDWMQRRLTILSPPHPPEVVAFPKAGVSNVITPVACDGRSILFVDHTFDPNNSPPAPRHRMRQDTLILLLGDATMNRRIAFLRLPDASSFDGLQQPFGTFAAIAANQHVLVTGTTADSGLTLRQYHDGTARTVTMFGLPVTRVTEAMREARRAFSERETPASIWNRELKEIYTAVPWPDRLPLWDRVILDGSDRVWVREYKSLVGDSSAGNRWHVTPAGAHRGAELRLPSSDDLAGVRGDSAITVHHSADGTESLEIRRILGL